MTTESSNKINITSTISTSINSPHDHHFEDEEIKVPLPGFRFYPTDEELIGFYLRRKVHNKLLNIQFIQQIDIYKYDPWDIPKGSSSSSTSTRGGNNEWYFFCKRGRKYKNSLRTNRVTGSGFWKATGIDKPVHSTTVAKSSDHHHQYQDNCIGLKKTLVYYRGSAGKGIKTDWMMHEFRLPDHNSNHILHSNTLMNHQTQEAEIWTLCRILKRNVAYKKFTTDSRELSAKRHLADRHRASEKSNFKNNMVESNINISQEAYIDFSAPTMISQLNNDDDKKRPAAMNLDHMINHHQQYNNNNNQFIIKNSFTSTHPILSRDSISTCSNDIPQDDYDLFTYGNIDWDELRSVVDLALNNDDHL